MNPRLQLGGSPEWTDGPPCTGIRPYTPSDCLDSADLLELDSEGDPLVPDDDDDPFAVDPETWALSDLYEVNDRQINVAFLDEGFSPNPDYRRRSDGTLVECDMEETPLRCRPGTAVHPPRIGVGLFGRRRWHGNMVVSHAGAVPNNGFGTGGVGGQVLTPMLYAYGFNAYVFQIGGGIRQAVDDEASVINISGGFPCKVQTTLGLDLGICTSGEILGSCSSIGAQLAIEALTVCEVVRWIPIVGDIACTVAGATVLAATGSCLSATLHFGELRAPMRAAVDYATARGVPVVSIAGNDPSNIPGILEPFVDTAEQRAEAWEIIPCTLPNVICVGAADRRSPYVNTEYFGEAVDIWAPDNGQYFGPADIDDAASEQVNLGRGGRGESGGQTSAATAYASGVIALLMAADPDLDPNNTTRSAGERALIPRDVRARLRATANPPDPRAPNRGPLINPLAVVRQAIGRGNFLYNLSTRFDLDYSLDEVASDPSDSPATATPLPGPLDVPNSLAGTVHEITDTGGTTSNFDEDWFTTATPNASGLYEVRVLVRSPWNRRFAFEPPTLEDSGFTFESGASSGFESIQIFRRTDALQGTNLPFRIHGDNHYRVSLASVTRTGDAPPADRFDFGNPGNTPETSLNNNDAGRAVRLGTRGDSFIDLVWVRTVDTSLRNVSTLTIPGLNFAQSEIFVPFGPNVFVADPADFYFIPGPPPHPVFSGDACLAHTLRVDSDPNIDIRFHTECSGNTVREDLREVDEGVVTLNVSGQPIGPDGCVGIEVTPDAPPGTVVASYDLVLTYETPGSACDF